VRPPVYKRSRRIDLPTGVLPNKYFLFFGQLSEVNGFDWLCRALPLVFTDVPDFRLVVVGVGDFSKVNRILESLGDLRSRILILYPVASELIESYVETADGVIVPSRVSNLPNTLLEALTLKRPVIGSNGASINELVVHNSNGLLVDIDDHQALAEAIINLWNNTSCVPAPGFTPEIEKLVMDYNQNIEALLEVLNTARSRG
jgi:glycosyltransferase involved in cell wall biosynthesis